MAFWEVVIKWNTSKRFVIIDKTSFHNKIQDNINVLCLEILPQWTSIGNSQENIKGVSFYEVNIWSISSNTFIFEV